MYFFELLLFVLLLYLCTLWVLGLICSMGEAFLVIRNLWFSTYLSYRFLFFSCWLGDLLDLMVGLALYLTFSVISRTKFYSFFRLSELINLRLLIFFWDANRRPCKYALFFYYLSLIPSSFLSAFKSKSNVIKWDPFVPLFDLLLPLRGVEQ